MKSFILEILLPVLGLAIIAGFLYNHYVYRTKAYALPKTEWHCRIHNRESGECIVYASNSMKEYLDDLVSKVREDNQ